jgi:hypothetical protein
MDKLLFWLGIGRSAESAGSKQVNPNRHPVVSLVRGFFDCGVGNCRNVYSFGQPETMRRELRRCIFHFVAQCCSHHHNARHGFNQQISGVTEQVRERRQSDQGASPALGVPTSGCTKPTYGRRHMPVSAKVAGRIAAQMKRYQGVLATIQKKDISEDDTVTVINDILADVCGYDKYHEVTSQYEIRGTFVDLAVKVDENIRFLIEVKAVGIELKDMHIKQAIDYAAN